ncbi:MAG: F0F1 ATP synthase subunit B [Mycoplasmataceae bacterium]|nr:F0F1 ATP synthase subunit B [Mycoplasmataceae bacterium]
MIKKRIFSVILATVWLVYICFGLTSCVDSEQIYDSLLPNFIIISIHTISTVLLIILSIWLVWNPTKKMMDHRREHIEKTLNEAEENKKESFARLLEAEQKRLDSYEEAQTIIERAKNEANYEFDSIISLAQSDAAKINENAKLDAISLKTKVEMENDKKITDIAFATTKELLKRNITNKDNKQFVDSFIKTLNQGVEK